MALSRRWFLASLPAACFGQSGAKGRVLPSAIKRYADPATEFTVLRLTDPAHASVISGPRAISKHGFLICASDVSGRYEAYRIELKSGQQRQLTEAVALDARSIVLTPDDRGIVYLDGSSVMTASLSSLHTREVYKIPDGTGRGLALAEDGLYGALVEPRGLRLINMAKGTAETLAEGDDISDPLPRPKRASVLYRRGGGLWLANYDAKQNYRLRVSEDSIGPALWSPDGRSIFYLSYPPDAAHKLHSLREFVPDSNEDKAIAETSQFVGIGRNTDASVFAGASGSKASPYVLLLVRAVKRELTICEHRASDPAMVCPVFSPNSQRVFFMSDRHGKTAIYSMAVEKLVEETETA
jgi:oligogalacturonide lyase